MSKRGWFINIEGTDGSGKTTQANLLLKAIQAAGLKAELISFPRYGQPSARVVVDYLNGKFGSSYSVTPYQASLFYALDRFASAAQIRQWLGQGKIVIANRYTLSNAAHQGGKLSSPPARFRYWRWLFDLEYNILNIPKADLIIVLHLPSAIAQKLVDKKGRREYLRGTRRDIHENDLKHLASAELAYLQLARQHSLPVVECVDQAGNLFSPQQINKEVLKIINQKIKKIKIT